jgi:hypothetical protein
MSIHLDVKLVADSISCHGERISTFALEYPRYIHSELMTHRMLSRNAQSSRAIPVEKLIKRTYEHKVVPAFAENKKGMQAGPALSAMQQITAEECWESAHGAAVYWATKLAALGVHKQWVNRLLEPFSTIVSVFTGTEDVWPHFFKLRNHPDAEPSFQELAQRMEGELEFSHPQQTHLHLPFVTSEEKAMDLSEGALMRLSAARCARVSYLTHEGKRDLVADYDLYERLAFATPPHESPLEHPAKSTPKGQKFANYKGWRSFRHSMAEFRTEVDDELIRRNERDAMSAIIKAQALSETS